MKKFIIGLPDELASAKINLPPNPIPVKLGIGEKAPLVAMGTLSMGDEGGLEVVMDREIDKDLLFGKLNIATSCRHSLEPPHRIEEAGVINVFISPKNGQ